MNKHIEQLLKDYKLARSNNSAYLKSLSDEELVKKMPRPGLDTFGKHFEELLDFLLDTIEGIKTGTMSFSNSKEVFDYKGETSKSDIIKRFQMADEDLVKSLQNVDLNKKIFWKYVNVEKSIIEHISFLISHETLHLGQFVAFSYVMDIEIPKLVKSVWVIPQ